MTQKKKNLQKKPKEAPSDSEALLPIPLGVGPERLLLDIVATYLLRKKKDITDTSVRPMAVNLLVALERYRQNRDVDAYMISEIVSLCRKLVSLYPSVSVFGLV